MGTVDVTHQVFTQLYFSKIFLSHYQIKIRENKGVCKYCGSITTYLWNTTTLLCDYCGCAGNEECCQYSPTLCCKNDETCCNNSQGCCKGDEKCCPTGCLKPKSNPCPPWDSKKDRFFDIELLNKIIKIAQVWVCL